MDSHSGVSEKMRMKWASENQLEASDPGNEKVLIDFTDLKMSEVLNGDPGNERRSSFP